MTVNEQVKNRDKSKILIIKLNGKEVFNSKHHSYQVFKRYADHEVLEVFHGKTEFGLNIKENENESNNNEFR